MEISLKKLIGSGAHFGHQTRRWNPKMKEYIYGQQEDVHIFDLLKTKKALEEALEKISSTISEGKTLVIVGTKKQAKDKIREVGESTGCFYVYERWLGGTITNFEQIKRSLRKMGEMKEKKAAGDYSDYTKKERLMIDREIARLERFFGGLTGMQSVPDLLFIVDTKKEKTAVREAIDMGIEVIGIVDSNADPTVIDYPIPMNDDATKAVEYVLDLVKEAIEEGKGAKGKSKSKAETAEGDVKKKTVKKSKEAQKKVVPKKKVTKKTKTSTKTQKKAAIKKKKEKESSK